ncbi:hypothetical protein BOTBODRAFT_106235 [Botryobasidium botryosum FD-172 SS1]|uniref:AAA+ ATPase domain-containing protein n=1 Tax=Botryobasidium botryosum (strain FD-172 SS1) TaxID=930990 RepID=A0A067MZZ8_BOTB1|nr:hypothetical protein BOTBODRAFT_106235 [Botryobasidium botryosum FD-172 SS1]
MKRFANNTSALVKKCEKDAATPSRTVNAAISTWRGALSSKPLSLARASSSAPVVTQQLRTWIRTHSHVARAQPVDRFFSNQNYFADNVWKPTTSWNSKTKVEEPGPIEDSEWLQEENDGYELESQGEAKGDVAVGEGGAEHVVKRHDWRDRATSRLSKRERLEKKTERLKFPRRYNPPVRVSPDQPYFNEIETYKKHFEPLLAAEQVENETVIRERLSQWDISRLVEAGYCLLGLRGFWEQATDFGRPVASFSCGPGEVLKWHRFENGTQVFVSISDPLGEDAIIGSVISRTNTSIRLSFDEKFKDLDKKEWRLDLGLSDIAYQRMRAAIDSLHLDPRNHQAEFSPGRQYISRGTTLRDILLKSFSTDSETPDEPASEASPKTGSSASRGHGIFYENQLIQSWAKRYRSENPLIMEGDPKLDLNASQIRAIALMLGERLSLVQGPPGTGKTKTIAEAVKLLKVHFEVPEPILVCTYTNVAVDNLVEPLAAAGLRPLRVGFAGNVKPELRKYTLDARMEEHPLAPERKRLLEEVKELESKARRRAALRDPESKSRKIVVDRGSSLYLALPYIKERLERIRSMLYWLKEQMIADILSEADVVCTTCITSACSALKKIDFPIVFLDEASMSTEPASLIPLMKGAEHVALIGDHKQLSPVVTSDEARTGGLGTSLFERLTHEGVPAVMLDTQYRMHPAISAFPSSEFYNLALRDGTIDECGHISARLLPPKSLHLKRDPETGAGPSVVFLDHGGAEAKKDRSKVNMNEAAIVCSVVEDLLLNNPDITGSDIGIIAPYAAQITLLDSLLKTDEAYKEHFKRVLGRHRALETADIEVKTVDGFEGREKDIIIFSTVRNNTTGHIGFLADRRRMNVGLTRARRGLFLVGNLRTLRAGKVGGGEDDARAWRRYMDYLKRKDSVREVHGTGLVQMLVAGRV